MRIGQGTTRAQALAAGGQALNGAELSRLVVGHTVWGDYPGGFRFVSYLDPDGHIAGTNNVGSDNTGTWHIDVDKGTLSTVWDQSWANSTAVAVSYGGVIHLFDAETGLWQTNFDRTKPGRWPLIA